VGGWIILKWIFESEWGGMDCTDLAEGRDQWRALVKHGNEPSGLIKCWDSLSSCTVGGLSRRAQLHGVSYQKYEKIRFLIPFSKVVGIL
jgi:hypothetical protein